MKWRKTPSIKRFRSGSKRRRQRMLSKRMHPTVSQSECSSERVGWPQEWESDYLKEASMMRENTAADQAWNDWQGAYGERGRLQAARARKWLVQGIFALALVVCVWLIETSTHPRLAPVQYWIAEAVTRDFDFVAVSSWYEERFASSPSFLPAFASQWLGFSAKSQEEEWGTLVGQVVKPFSPQHQGVLLKAATGGTVTAVGTGWVVDVTEHPGLGPTVVVQHPRGKQTWYANLRDVNVAKEDWVYSGDVIGRAGADGQWFLAVRQGNVFIDPMSVLAIEE